jgi:hypothetical protein
MNENFDCEIKLNDIQMKLYRILFKINNQQSLLGILAKNYYYLDFNIQYKSKFKFHLNYEIIPLISFTTIDENYKRTIINYNSFKFKSIDELKDLSIFSLEKTPIIFLINYAILLSSTLFSNINMKNFISLIYIYIIIKNNTKNYLNLYNYNGENPTLIIYRDYIKTINFLNFIKSILFLMKIKLKFNISLRKFIQNVINFNENPIIKKPVNMKININFLQILFNKQTYELNDQIIEDLYLSFLLLYNNCLRGKINDNTINMFHIFLIPLLKFFHKKYNIRDIENEILDIKAYEYIKLIGYVKGGIGDDDTKIPEKPKNPIDINKAKEELKGDKLILTTDLSDDTKDILKLMEIFNTFYLEFDKLNLKDLVVFFKEKIDEYYLIYKAQEKPDKQKNIYIITDDKQSLFIDYKGKNRKEAKNEILMIRNSITENLRKLEAIKSQFDYKSYDEKNEDKLNEKAIIFAKVQRDYNEIMKSLTNTKDGISKYITKSQEVKNIYNEFFPEDENIV